MRPRGIEPRRPGDLVRAVLFGEQVVVCRALLHFERIERPPGAPDARMRAAFMMAGRARAPFERPGLHLVWQARHVVVWSWDQGLLASFGIAPDAWIIPQPQLELSRPGSGMRLVPREGGVEAQFWQAEALTASRFWPREPALDETDQFRRSADGSAQMSGPEPAGAAPGPVAGLADLLARLRPAHALLAVILVMLTPLMFSFGHYLRLATGLGAARDQLETFAAVSADDLEALERFRASGVRLTLYRDALEGLNPLQPAAELAETASAAGARILQLRIEPGLLLARLETGPLLDPASLTEALEAQPSLENVRLARPGQGAGLDVEAALVRPDTGAVP